VIHDKAKVVAHLRGLSDGSVEPTDIGHGICMELSEAFFDTDMREGEWSYALAPLFDDWPEFTGWSMFPVPDSDNGDPCLIYRAVENVWIGEYGASRRRLCAHLADKIEAMEGELDV
jgi:hypothetical protein